MQRKGSAWRAKVMSALGARMARTPYNEQSMACMRSTATYPRLIDAMYSFRSGRASANTSSGAMATLVWDAGMVECWRVRRDNHFRRCSMYS